MQRPRLWLLPLLLAVLVGGGWYFGVRSKAGDRELPVYVTGGERMRQGEEIYRRGADSKPFTYPPFAAVPFVVYGALPTGWQAPLWFAANFLLLLLLLRWLHRWARRDWPGAGPPRLAWLWVGAGLLALRHVFSVFENQSHDLLVFASVLLANALAPRADRRGAFAAGVAAGLGAAIKATPLLFVVWFAVGRRWWALAGTVLAAVALTLLPDWWWPRTDGRSWAMAWYDINLRGLSAGGSAVATGAWDSHSVQNQSLSGTLTRLFSTPTTVNKFVLPEVVLVALPATLLRAVLAMAQLGVVLTIVRGALWTASEGDAAQRARMAMGMGGLVACGMVLLSPQSSKAHFCVLLVPAVFCVDRLLRFGRDRRLLGLLVAAALLGAGTTKGLWGSGFGGRMLGYGAVTWSTVLLLVATLRALRSPARQAP